MTLYLESEGGFSAWHGEVIGDIRYPLNIEELWPPADLVAVGLYLPVDPGVPDGKISTGSRVERVGGIVTIIYDLIDAPLSVPANPVLSCLANLSIDGGDVAAVEAGATGLAFAFAVAPDVIWLFFAEEMPDTNYSPNVSSSSGVARVTDRQVGYVEVTVENAVEPYTLFIQVFRTI